MKKILYTLLVLLAAIDAGAENNVLRIMRNNINDYVKMSSVDSIFFDIEGNTMFIQPVGKKQPIGIPCAVIDRVEFVSQTECPAVISVTYNGNTAQVENPFLLAGVSAEVDGAYVTVRNTDTTTEYTTELAGTTTDGGFLYEGSYKTTLVLNGVNITSQHGAAIDIQCGKRVAMELKKGTVNTLADAADGQQKAALYCKGHLEIDKSGTLNVTGRAAHAISAKEYIVLKKSAGIINVLGAKGDGIHCRQYFCAKGFDVNISNVGGDGIQAEAEDVAEGETYQEEYQNGSINIADGSMTITVKTDGGIKTEEEEKEPAKSYKVYVAKTTGTSGGPGGNRGNNYWGTIYLYKSDGTLVSTLTNTVTLTGSNGQSLQFYYYDFGKADSGSYYFKSDNYTSQSYGGGTQYTIKSTQFSGPQSGIDYYYQISNSYTTSGTTRTFQLNSVQEIYGGGGSTESGDTYYYNCLKADRLLDISGGTLKLTNSGKMSKAIKVGNSDNEGTVSISGGEVSCFVSGDMYLVGAKATYCSAIKTDKYYGTGGVVDIQASTGKAVGGISADNLINISGGTYSITNSSNGYQGSNDIYTAKAIKCDKDILLTGGEFNIKATGTGGKGIKADGQLTIGDNDNNGPVIIVSTSGAAIGSTGGGGFPGQQSGTSSSSKAIKAVGQVTVNGGNMTITTSTNGAEGLESKTSVLIKGGNHYMKCYDDCINSAGVINFAGGNTVCYATNNDAVDSNYGRSGAITISGGNVFAYTSAGSPEEGLDCDNNSYITITGGIAVSAGGKQGGGGSSSTASVGSATQGYYLGSSPSSYSSTNYYTLYNTSGQAVCTYRFDGNVSNTLSLLTAPNLGKGNVTVKQGTSAPTSCSEQVDNVSGKGVFYLNPTVSTSSTTATVTSK